MQSKVRSAILLLTYTSMANCLGRFDYNAVLSLGLFYWLNIEKMLFSVTKIIRVLIGLTILVDIVYFVTTILWMRGEKDPFLNKIAALNVYSLALTIFEIALKTALLVRLIMAKINVN